MTDYISREAFAAEMKERQTEAEKWLRDAKDHDTAVRADAVLSFLCEVKLTLDKLPAADVRPVKWIPVTERLPEPEGHSEYIVCVKHFNPEYTRNVLVTTAEFEARLIECGDGPYWVGHNDGITRVTHWMPLPPAPKEE